MGTVTGTVSRLDRTVVLDPTEECEDRKAAGHPLTPVPSFQGEGDEKRWDVLAFDFVETLLEIRKRDGAAAGLCASGSWNEL